MTRFIRNKLGQLNDWQSWQFFHDAFTKVVGICILLFLSLCFWNVYQRAEPTTISMTILAFMSATAMLFNGGRGVFESWLRSGPANFQQSTTTTTATVASTAGVPLPDPVMPVGTLDEDGEIK